ncbi:MAG: hypothetical protein P9E24_15055 [Candidatus Competibacter sp.]|nr:hypothetical protein [Candidatus Competibacter sp.]MDG4583495.1 hypothetical protein [Candidatus Competibacter sp.]
MPRIDPEKLKKLLGQILLYQGQACQVIEILSEESALVLRDHRDRKVLQANQYGNASGWAPRTFTVALLDARRDRLNPDLPRLADLDLLV